MRWMLGKVIPYTILTIIAIMFLLPLLWVIVASFDSSAAEVLRQPESLTLENYKNVLTNSVNLRSFGNGLLISLGQCVIVVVISGLAAYPLSRYEMKNKNMFMLTMLFMTSLPITAIMVPVYQMFLNIKLYDNLFGVTIFMASSSMPYAIWMMKNFMDSVVIELEEAAWVDGATTMQSIIKIVVPLMLPGVCTIAIYTFSGSWGNFFVPYILLNAAEKYPASVQLYQYFGMHGMIAYGELAAFSVIYTAPSVILYIISQKYMSKGFSMAGGAKG